MTRAYAYALPPKKGDGEEVVCETAANSVVVIGANGAGKSKLGAWMERRDLEGVHRIGGQRSLNFKARVALKSLKGGQNELLYGMDDAEGSRTNWSVMHEKYRRYGTPGEEETTHLLDDYDSALSVLFALDNEEGVDYRRRSKGEYLAGRPALDPGETALEKALRVWNDVFPQRLLEARDGGLVASTRAGETAGVVYPANKMSDGERAALYLIAQVLAVPNGKTVIVDEPEVHLHPSITGRLWCRLEAESPECLFVFITHDTAFASDHVESDKIWVKSYDGSSWDWEKVVSGELPEQLVLDILGSRKDVLFVEGEPGGLDCRLYEALYPGFRVVPCGGCDKVVERTRAFRACSGLAGCRAHGIVDRDRRGDEEVAALEADGVGCLGVAEVENLLLEECVVRAVARRLCQDPDKVFDEVANRVLDVKLASQIGGQARMFAVSEAKFLLSRVDLRGGSEREIRERFESQTSEIDIGRLLSEARDRIERVLESRDYPGALSLLNDKGTLSEAGKCFGAAGNVNYGQLALGLIESPDGAGLREQLRKIIPSFDQRE